MMYPMPGRLHAGLGALGLAHILSCSLQQRLYNAISYRLSGLWKASGE